MDTKFASPERESKESILADFNVLNTSSFIQELINALPNIAIILNSSRQVVFSNNKIVDILSLDSIVSVLGKRFGEIVNCKNAYSEEGGCGTSEACRYCGAVNTIENVLNAKNKETNECRIITKINEQDVAFDFAVSASTISWANKEYIFLTLADISDEKRRRILEKVFFHDIINTAGSLNGLLSYLKEVSDKEQLIKYISLAGNASNDLLEEIMMQRELLAAENNELQISTDLIFSKDFLQSIINHIKGNIVASNKEIVVDENAACVSFVSDYKLLKRVVINMVINALEAESESGKIIIGSYCNKENITIWVHNSTFINRDVQLQLFQRNFSTKGTNRGLGTYSMKLFGEKYLNGKVFYTTDNYKGTTFFVELPLSS